MILASLLAPAALALENRGGTLMQDGRPFRGIGVNTPDLFERILHDSGDTTYRAAFRRLRDRGIPFTRFWCGAWGPEGWALYLQDPQEYFRRLDRFVAAAEEFHVGLIPVMAWRPQTIPALMGAGDDNLAPWGDTASPTLAFLRDYAGRIAGRYASSPAVWGWEFGNEYNLFTDHRKDFRTADLRAALREFGRAIRAVDAKRVLLAGNSLPRKAAWHLETEGTWTEDSPDEFGEALAGQNPDPINTLSVHVYPDDGYPGKTATLDACLALAQAQALRSGKPLWAGEFGVPAGWPADRQAQVFGEFLGALEKNRVPLAAVWVYAFPPQDTSWNISDTGPRAFMLDAIQDADARMRAEEAGIRILPARAASRGHEPPFLTQGIARLIGFDRGMEEARNAAGRRILGHRPGTAPSSSAAPRP